MGRKLAVGLAYIALFLILDRFSLYYTLWRSVSAWYPAAGLSIALLLGVGLEYAPAVAVAYVVGGFFDWSWNSYSSEPASLALAAIYIGAVVVLRRGCRINSGLLRVRDMSCFIGVVLSSSIVAAAVGIWAEIADGSVPRSQRALATFSWWIGDAAGIVAVAPFLLIYVAPWVRRWIRAERALPAPRPLWVRGLGLREGAEIAAQSASVLLVIWIVFSWRAERYQLLYLYFIPLLWIALRHGLPGTTIGVLGLNFATAATSAWFRTSAEGLGRFQLVLLAVSVTGLVVATIVSERWRAEEALRVSEGRYRDLVDGAGAIVWEADALTGQFNFVSQQAENLLGYPITRWLCEPNFVLKMIHADDVVRVVTEHTQAFEAKQDYDQEFRAITKDHRLLWLHTRVRLILDDAGQPAQLRGLITDVTERRQSEEALRELSGRLLRLQDEERRRIARELHDGTAQNLGALLLDLTQARELAAVAGQPKLRESIDDGLALAEESVRGVRTLSYLLHPPLLDEAGLSAALRQFVGGFSERSGVSVELQIDPGLGRLPPDVEIALFRVAQECLTNIRRHSGSATAKLQLARNADEVTLELSDTGKGIAQNGEGSAEESVVRLGVGIPGMQERMRQLGGRLEIHSNQQGTVVKAVVPWS
jgi:PAS domain S-box-containing protein